MDPPSRFLNAPNVLTLSRLPLAVLLWIHPEDRSFVLSILALAGLTDVLDGWCARRMHSHHPAGVWLDPLCDKAFVLSALFSISMAQRVPRFVPFLIAMREAIQLPLASFYCAKLAKQKEINVRPALIGKLATCTQFFAMAAMLLRHSWTVPLAVIAGVTGLGAGGFYARRSMNTIDSKKGGRVQVQGLLHWSTK